MKRFQSLLASFVLSFVLAVAFAASVAAGDGTIHTGSPGVPHPTPTPDNIVVDDGPVEGEPDGGEPTALDLVVRAALDYLHAAFTLF